MPPEYLHWRTREKNAYRHAYPEFDRHIAALRRFLLQHRPKAMTIGEWEFLFPATMRRAAAEWEPAVVRAYTVPPQKPNTPRTALHRPKKNQLRNDRAAALRKWRDNGGRCFYCAEPIELETLVTTDHVVPLSAGGSHGPDNVVPACSPCNQEKGGRTIREWVNDQRANRSGRPRRLQQWLREKDLRVS